MDFVELYMVSLGALSLVLCVYTGFYSIFFRVTSILSCVLQKRSCLSFFRFSSPGGGSSLLPLPCPPITLAEETELTKTLSQNGATINDLNTIRKHIEELKGGGLAKAAHPAQVRPQGTGKLTRGRLGLILVCLTVYQGVEAKGM